jgi:hypothetical protein
MATRRGTNINIRYLVEFVDEGTQPMLAADRKVRTSVSQTNKVFADQAAVTGDLAAEQAKLAAETARAAVGEADLGKAATDAAGGQSDLAKATAAAATNASRAAKAAAEAAAAYTRETTAGMRVVGVQRQMSTSAAAQAAAARRSAAAQKESAAAAGMSANRFTAAGAAMTAHGKRVKETKGALDGMLLPLALAAGASVKLGVDFNASMTRVHTQAGASAAEVGRLRGQVLQLAKSMPQSPQQLSEGLYHLESIGLRGAKAMHALKIASQGAAVSGADLESTASALGAAWRAGIKGAGNLDQTMGDLNATAGAGNMRMQDLVEALGTGILPAAKNAGLSIRDVGGAIALLTDEGYQASSAAAQLGTAFHFLTNPSMKAGDAMKAMGLNTDTLARDMHKPNGLLVALRDLKSHLEEAGKHSGKQLQIGLNTTLPATSPEVRQEQLLGSILPGGRGRVLNTVLNNLDVYDLKLKQIAKTSSSFGEAVKKTQETPLFRLKSALSEVEVAGIHFGDALIPAVVPVLGEVAHLTGQAADAFSAMPVPLRTAAIGFTLLAAASGPVVKLYGGLVTGGGRVVSMLGALRTALFGYTAAQKAAAIATATTTEAEAAQGEVQGAKGLTGMLGRRGGLLSMLTRGSLAETTASASLARGVAGGGLAGDLAGGKVLAMGLLRGVAPLALGASLVDGIIHGVESKRSDFGGKLQDFLHGATFGIVHSAGADLQHRVAKEYTRRDQRRARRCAHHAERGYGETLLQHAEPAAPDRHAPGRAVPAHRRRPELAQSAAQRHREPRSAARRSRHRSIERAARQSSPARPRAVRARFLRGRRASCARSTIGCSRRAEHHAAAQGASRRCSRASTRRERSVVSRTCRGCCGGRRQRPHLAEAAQDRVPPDRPAGEGAARHRPPPARRHEVGQQQRVTRFTTRNLRAGADRSVGEINKDISSATADMKAHGVTPGSAEFTREQQQLARAAISNVKKLYRDGRHQRRPGREGDQADQP